MILVADASALIALVACNGLDFLHKLFSDVYVPRSVYDELCTEGKPFCAELREFLAPHCVEIDVSDFVITDVPWVQVNLMQQLVKNAEIFISPALFQEALRLAGE